MRSYILAKGIIKAISFFLGLGLLLFVLYQLRTLIIYLVIAAVLTLLCRPLVYFFRERLNISKTLGAVIALVIALAIMSGLGLMFVPMLAEQTKQIAVYDPENIQVELDKVYEKISEYSGASKQDVADAVKETEIEKSVMEEMDDEEGPTLMDRLINILTQLSIGLLSVLFMSFFMLKDHSSIQRFLLAMIPKEHRKQTISSLDKIKDLLSRYFLGLVLQIFILFIIYAITLYLVGTENALIVSFFCALFNIIPYAGPVIGAVFMALLTLTSHSDIDFSNGALPLVGYVLIGVTIGQLVDNFISQPFIYSNSVKSHPMEIFVIIIASGLLFGIMGMMVAVPMYAVLKVIIKEFYWRNGFVRFWTKGI
ncbi:AI-2E family transporter [Flavimarina sp. Hel_I_48]|uniref:AI-2E family transporter n=1 Tax=Flavimarina sp. Hel_I_48 TaxID=1392488 RepID=UPI0004DF7DD4|nr:AI-2E family transporter [Flavimarina sp. Hel_I_48]